MADNNKTSKPSTSKPARKYTDEQKRNIQKATQAVYEYYGADVSPKVVNSILGNIEVETSFLDNHLREKAYDWDGLQSNVNLKTARKNVAKWGGTKEEFNKLPNEERLSIMYWGDDKHTATAGGSGAIQLTSANYGGNDKTDTDLRKAAEELGLDINEINNDFYNSTLATLKVFENRGRDFKDHAESPASLRKVINGHEEPTKNKAAILDYYNTDDYVFPDIATAIFKDTSSVNPDEIKKNPSLDDGAKEELLKMNESEGLEQSTIDAIRQTNSPIAQGGANTSTGYRGSFDLSQFLVSDDNDAKQQKVDQARQKGLGHTGDISAFAPDHNLLENSTDSNAQFEQGGNLDSRQEANQVTEYNEGGSHGQNPLGGVPVGPNQQGGQNLVEQGETRHEDYIYSNAFTLDENDAARFNLNSKYIGKSFSDISRDINSEIKNRPFDRLTTKTAKGNLNRLMMAQETIKQEQDPQAQPSQDQQFFAGGALAAVSSLGGGAGIIGGASAASQLGASAATAQAGLGTAHAANMASKAGGPGLLAKMGGASGVAGAAGTALDLAQTAFGDPGIEKNGTEGRQKNVNKVGMIGSNALKGASTGMQVGGVPGAVIGGLLGGAAGALGGDKAQEATSEANRNAEYIKNNANVSTFHEGGSLGHTHRRDEVPSTPGFTHYRQNPLSFTGMSSLFGGVDSDNNTAPANPEYPVPGSKDRTRPRTVGTWGSDPNSWVGALRNSIFGNDSLLQKELGVTPEGAKINVRLPQTPGPLQPTPLLPPETATKVDPDEDYYFHNSDKVNGQTAVQESATQPSLATQPIAAEENPYTGGNLINTGAIDDIFNKIEGNHGMTASEKAAYDAQAATNPANSATTTNTTADTENSTPTEKDATAKELLRYAPTLGNLAQYMNVPDAEVEKYDRLDGRYKPEYVDEKSLENRVAQSAANTRRALNNNFGGSQSAARASLLASQLNETKGLSDAMGSAQAANRGTNDRAQQFNSRLDQINQRTSMAETVANSQNRAAREDFKQSLLQNMMNDAGAIGKEATQARTLYNMSDGYNTDGTKGDRESVTSKYKNMVLDVLKGEDDATVKRIKDKLLATGQFN
jgi:hypothetical protein